jgi:hypothetical protein
MERTNGGKFFHHLIGGTERGEANLLRKLCKFKIGEQRGVTEQFMAHVTAKI